MQIVRKKLKLYFIFSILAERTLRTIKNLLSKLRDGQKIRTLKVALKVALKTYNNTVHLAFENKFTPAEAIDPANYQQVLELKIVKEAKWAEKNQEKIEKANSRFQNGDIVRLRLNVNQKPSGQFTKEYQFRLTSELFRIVNVIQSGGLFSYKLEALDGSYRLPGTYTSEMMYSVAPN